MGFIVVIPAKEESACTYWIPAFAGMTPCTSFVLLVHEAALLKCHRNFIRGPDSQSNLLQLSDPRTSLIKEAFSFSAHPRTSQSV